MKIILKNINRDRREFIASKYIQRGGDENEYND
jgi:hypothetical protein